MKVENQVLPPPQQAMAFFTAPEDGPFVMVNLLKFHDRAQYEDGDRGLSGYDAYMLYGEAVRKLVEGLGGQVRYQGRVTDLMLGEVEELWDVVALAEYPSLESFRNMAMSPEMHAIEHHRKAGLKGQLNIKTKPGEGF
ncbi:MAG: DUF1330 domain-containing protein [Phenylobacterium sp.]|uniref:DUF1330 domain-containing protein n=1 Tax=Phenylobacterium sp. TaxID=1871053 RepID=UPI0025CFBFB8|nr:DUF1330 domain-containing protein [Phenylobacterium sp.]MBI1200859.1 DUF1330 domain-containing protein [Phenylobacterium sp.]